MVAPGKILPPPPPPSLHMLLVIVRWWTSSWYLILILFIYLYQDIPITSHTSEKEGLHQTTHVLTFIVHYQSNKQTNLIPSSANDYFYTFFYKLLFRQVFAPTDFELSLNIVKSLPLKIRGTWYRLKDSLLLISANIFAKHCFINKTWLT